MKWRKSNRADPEARSIADRHYNRQKIGAPQFVPPGSCLVLISDCGKALWVTSFPIAKYVQHAWAGAWVCSLFRNESAYHASELIEEAVAATRAWYGMPPPLGMVTFIDRKHVKPVMVRGEATYGWTWRKIGFEEVGLTKTEKLLVFQMRPSKMPFSCAARP